MRRPWSAPTLLLAISGLASPPGPASGQGAPTAPLFSETAPLPLSLTADFSTLVEDRRASPERPAIVVLQSPEGARVSLTTDVRTRGEFRLDPSNCSFPPLRLDFDRNPDADGTALEGQNDVKLVSSCRPGRASYDRLVVLEYLAYRAYAVVTDRSFKVRAVELTLHDGAGLRPDETRFGFLIEDADALADRLGGTVFDLPEGRNLPATSFEPTSTIFAAVFQYMIGNPDWSEIAAHNVEIVDRGGTALAVPYDFDFSGLVDAPYPTPPPELQLSSVRERYYRGWCNTDAIERLVLGVFRDRREQILDLFRYEPRLEPDVRDRAVRYLGSFFTDIETDERASRRLFRSCRTL